MKSMRWALGRQLLFALGAIVILGGIGVWVYFSSFYTPPSCFDGAQNQDEIGIDCGGLCARLCEAPNISVMWARSVEVAPGVYHAVAMVRNPDTASSGTVSYEVTLFDEENILITRRSGVLAVGPGEIAPLFEANIPTGERIPARTFVEVLPGLFEKDERELSPVRVLNFNLDEEALRLTATIENQGTTRISDVQIIALLYNAEGTLVGASQTLSGTLERGERKDVVFTWQDAFAEAVARTDIVPRIISEN